MVMQYLVWLIYIIVVAEWLYQGKNAKRLNDVEDHGHKYYCVVGDIDFILAFSGFVVLSEFEKKIPKFLFVTGCVGCAIMLGIAIYNIYKMMTTNK